jgi:glycerol-3-phosphate O-acyltransferase
MLRGPLDTLYERLFANIEIDPSWIECVRDAASRGRVVYVLRSVSFIDLFALDYITRKYALPRLGFSNIPVPWLFETSLSTLRGLIGRQAAPSPDGVRSTLKRNDACVIFLKRSASFLDGNERSRVEAEPFIREMIDFQREGGRPILLVPQVFLWTRLPDEAQLGALDWVLGPREWPGYLRSVGQYISSYGNVVMKSGLPIDLMQFLDAEGAGKDDGERVSRLVAMLLGNLESERKAITGPTRKTPDQLHEEIIRSPRLEALIRELAGDGAAERAVVTAKALAMLREMESALDLNTIAAMARAFERVTSHMYEALEVDQEGLAQLRELSKRGTLVMLPSHKSHIDYMLLAYVCYRNSFPVPLVAAGDNLNFFPLGYLFRRAGAFYIRRKFTGDRLYVAVVDAYMRRLIQDGWALEFFLEGGRSRTGKLLAPKFGLLSMVVDAAIGNPQRVYFCPISIGYERFVEEKSFVRELTGGEKRKEDVRGLMSTFALMMGRYGRLNIQFGEPLSIDGLLLENELPLSQSDQWSGEQKRGVTRRLGYRVMNEINRVTAVTPGALVACALLAHQGRGIAHDSFVALCNHLASSLREQGARFTPSLVSPTDSQALRPAALREALELYLRAGHIEAHRPGSPEGSNERQVLSDDSIYVLRPGSRLVLDLSKNVVMHFFVERALIATCVLASRETPVSEDDLRTRVRQLSRLFKFEFSFRADAHFDQIFSEELTAMVDAGYVERKAAGIAPTQGEHLGAVGIYANLMRNFIEGYRIAARALTNQLRGSLSQKDFVKRAMSLGERMFLAGEITCREAVSRPLLENALSAFSDQGYVERDGDGKFRLTASYAQAETVHTIEAKVAGFLPRELDRFR